MPFNTNKKQATAAFLSIMRQRGKAAAKAFGAKHRTDLKAEARPYRPRSNRD